MGLLTRETILATDDRRIERVSVPEWGGEVCVQSVTAGERDRFETALVQQNGRSRTVTTENTRARVVALCACDEAGNRIFRDEDVELLAEKSAGAMERVFDMACALNKFTQTDVEDLVKNSGKIPASDSPSD